MHVPLRIAALPSTAPFDGGPMDVATRWPQDRPLVMLGSGRPHPRWSRWSILAEPRDWLLVPEDSASGAAAAEDPLALLARSLRATRRPGVLESNEDSSTAEQLAGAELPFLGGWIGCLGYELGRTIEPAVRGVSGAGEHVRRRPDGHRWPLMALARAPRALLHDRARMRWWSVGPEGEAPLESVLAASRSSQPRGSWTLEPPRETVPAAEWQRAVERAIEYIRDGDIYQANITHLLRSRLRGSPRAMGLAALDSAQPWHGALIELPDGASVVSLSPELFLCGELSTGSGGSGFVVTRPIKGTRPAAVDPADLLRSAKDEAELTMIVDLMRNDLGRVCVAGSVDVSEQRHVEQHPTVHQGVATVQGRLRADVDAAALLRATFPPGSVTGAPKIRAMQIVEELEPHPRGPYCGAIGYFSDHGRFGLNVAIRTLAIAPPRDGASDVLYGVGCGIVADSDPQAEWEESMDKAAVLREICRGK